MYLQPYFSTLQNNNSNIIPTDLSGLRLWLDGADSSSMTNDGGGVISQWRDKSGLSNHSNATLTARPLLVANVKAGNSILRFDGVLNFMSLTSNIVLTGEYTRFAVVMNTLTAGNKFYFGHTANQKEGYTAGTPIKYALRVVTSVDTINNYPIAQNAFGLISSARNSSNIVEWLSNNSSYAQLFSGVAQSGSNTISQIGKDETINYWTGDMAELLVYNRRLSASEVESVKAYLNNKWQIY
jgi:hypothetical protein